MSKGRNDPRPYAVYSVCDGRPWLHSTHPDRVSAEREYVQLARYRNAVLMLRDGAGGQVLSSTQPLEAEIAGT